MGSGTIPNVTIRSVKEEVDFDFSFAAEKVVHLSSSDNNSIMTTADNSKFMPPAPEALSSPAVAKSKP